MTHDDIKKIYETILNDYAITKDIRIAYHNVKFTPSANETYLKSNIIPSVTGSYTLSGDHTVLIGRYQITVVTPLHKGTAVAEGIAKDIRNIFKNVDIKYPMDSNNLPVGNVFVQQMTPIETTQGFVGDTVFTYPLRFKYRCDFN